MHLEKATIHGRSVCYATGGAPASHRVLVLVHAFPVGVRMWQSQLDAFPGWRVVAPALPGFDGSDPISDPSVETYAAWLASVVAHLGIDSALFAGVSMGGYILFALHRTAPHLIDGLVLADTRSGADTPDGRAARETMRATLRQYGPARIADDLLPRLVGKTSTERRPEVISLLRRMIESQPPAAIDAALQAMLTRPDAAPGLPAIEAPTLVIVGEEDLLTPPADADALHRAIRGSTLARMPAAGHLANVENPDAFNAAVGTFLQTLAPEFRGGPVEPTPR